MYFILYTKIMVASKKVMALATATGIAPSSIPYVSHKSVPAVKNEYMVNDIPEVSLVRIVLMAWGKKDTVVPNAAR